MGWSTTAVAMAKDLPEPGLARVACQVTAESRGLLAAQEVAHEVLAGCSTDPAYDELALRMTWHERAAVVDVPAQQAAHHHPPASRTPRRTGDPALSAS